jgi:hypothetical protein
MVDMASVMTAVRRVVEMASVMTAVRRGHGSAGIELIHLMQI